jgi:molecular chaperone GrpE
MPTKKEVPGEPETLTNQEETVATATSEEQPKTDDLTVRLLQQTQHELAELKDRYLRALADMANMKKKMVQERRHEHERGIVTVIEDLLPILDNLERAEDAIQQKGNLDSLREGIFLIYNQLRSGLKKRGVEPIKAVGEQFDPFYHEAAGHVATNDVPENEVVQELQRGYRMGDKVLRASKVLVATQKTEE